MINNNSTSRSATESTGGRESYHPVGVEFGARGAASGHPTKRRQVRLGRRRPTTVVHQQCAQRLTDITEQLQIGVIEDGVGCQHLVVDQPRARILGISESVGPGGQLYGVDQRLNSKQPSRRRLGFVVRKPTRRFGDHESMVSLYDR